MDRKETILLLLKQLKSPMEMFLRLEKLNLLRDLCYKEKDIDVLKVTCGVIIDVINKNIIKLQPEEQRNALVMLKDAHTQYGAYNFESFLIAMEWDRPVEKRFYQPRMKILKAIVQDIQDIGDGKLEIYGLSMPPRVGKLLSDDTKVLTSNGWRTHGDLKVGDEVINPDGEFVKITHVHPKHHTTHTVTISDGSEFECHFRHEWRVYDRRDCKYKNLETQDMMGKLRRGSHFNFLLEHKTPFVGSHRDDLKIPPYTFGVWLGDGSNNNPRITMAREDEPVINKVISEGYKLKRTYVHKTTNVPSYEFDKLRFDLQEYGLCHSRKRNEKYIPDEYLTSSLEQRLELLAGLLDTDGTLTKKENRYSFSTTGVELKDGIISLISTFGWRCSVVVYPPCLSSSGIQGRKEVYSIGFNPTMFIPCVLERKQLRTFSKQRRLSIVSIEESEHKQGNCITVERDGMYCVGDRLTPTHNTTLGLFGIAWMGGRFPDEHIFGAGYASGLVGTFYNGVLDFVSSPEYRFIDIFPDVVVNKSSENKTIDLFDDGRYKTITFRSIDGQITGALEASSLLYLDDMCSGIEEAMNLDRLDKLWQKVSVDLMQRRVNNKRTGSKAPIIAIGTIWSLHDPLSRLRRHFQNDPKARFRVLPAISLEGKSNFEYDYGVGFTTTMFRDMQSIMDEVSWECVYQQNPVERDGLLFPTSTLKRYLQLPNTKPDNIIAFCDVAFGSDDFLSFPIAYIYGSDMYLVDVVFRKKASYKITEPMVVGKIISHKIQSAEFEANNGGDFYARDVIDMLTSTSTHRCNITWRSAGNRITKLARIIQYQDDIRNVYYKDQSLYKSDDDYGLFMTNLTTFVQTGSSRNDDAPDSNAGLCSLAKIPRLGSMITRSGIRGLL